MYQQKEHAKSHLYNYLTQNTQKHRYRGRNIHTEELGLQWQEENIPRCNQESQMECIGALCCDGHTAYRDLKRCNFHKQNFPCSWHLLRYIRGFSFATFAACLCSRMELEAVDVGFSCHHTSRQGDIEGERSTQATSKAGEMIPISRSIQVLPLKLGSDGP